MHRLVWFFRVTVVNPKNSGNGYFYGRFEPVKTSIRLLLGDDERRAEPYDRVAAGQQYDTPLEPFNHNPVPGIRVYGSIRLYYLDSYHQTQASHIPHSRIPRLHLSQPQHNMISLLFSSGSKLFLIRIIQSSK